LSVGSSHDSDTNRRHSRDSAGKRNGSKDLKSIACNILKNDSRLILKRGRICSLRRASFSTDVSRAWQSRFRTASQPQHIAWNEYHAVNPARLVILCASAKKDGSFDGEPIDADRERNARGHRGDLAPDVPVSVFILGKTLEAAASGPFGNPGDDPPERPRRRLGDRDDLPMLLFPGAYALALAVLILCHLIAIYSALLLAFEMFPA